MTFASNPKQLTVEFKNKLAKQELPNFFALATQDIQTELQDISTLYELIMSFNSTNLTCFFNTFSKQIITIINPVTSEELADFVNNIFSKLDETSQLTNFIVNITRPFFEEKTEKDFITFYRKLAILSKDESPYQIFLRLLSPLSQLDEVLNRAQLFVFDESKAPYDYYARIFKFYNVEWLEPYTLTRSIDGEQWWDILGGLIAAYEWLQLEALPSDVLPKNFSGFYRSIFSTWASSQASFRYSEERLKEWFAWGEANLPRFHQEFDAFLEYARNEYYDNRNKEISPSDDLLELARIAAYKRPISTPDDLKALLEVYFFKLPHYSEVLERCNWENFFQTYSFQDILSIFVESPDTYVAVPIYEQPSSPATPNQITTPSFDKPSKTSSFFNVSSNVSSTTLVPTGIVDYKELGPRAWTKKIAARPKEDEFMIIHEIYKSIPNQQWKEYPNFYKSLPSLFIHFKGIFEGRSFIRSAVDGLVATNLLDACDWGDLDEQSVLAIMENLSVMGRNQLSKYFNFKWPSLGKYASPETRVDYLLAHIKQIPQCTQEEVDSLVHTERVDNLKRTELLFWAGTAFPALLETDLDAVIKKALSVYSDRLQDPKTINAWFDELPSDAAATIFARLREVEAEIITCQTQLKNWPETSGGYVKSVFREESLKLVGLIIIGGIVGAILAVLLPAGPLLGPMVGIGGTLILALVACFVLEKLIDCFSGFIRFEKSSFKEELDNYQSTIGTIDLNVIKGFCDKLESMNPEDGFKETASPMQQ